MIGSPLQAQLRDFCASRPGLGTPACTVEPGRIIIELGIVDWTLENSADERTETLIGGDFAVRIGLDELTEVSIAWSAFGHVRVFDKANGAAASTTGVGDVTLGLRRSLSGPNGSVAVQPYITVPVGGVATGAGDWSAGIVVPVEFDLGGDLKLALSPQIEATANESRSGRHLSYGSVIGLSFPLAGSLSAALEAQATRDEDPSGTTTQALASASLAWLVDDDTQFDVGGVVGLNPNSPDVQLYVGISRRF